MYVFVYPPKFLKPMKSKIRRKNTTIDFSLQKLDPKHALQTKKIVVFLHLISYLYIYLCSFMECLHAPMLLGTCTRQVEFYFVRHKNTHSRTYYRKIT